MCFTFPMFISMECKYVSFYSRENFMKVDVYFAQMSYQDIQQSRAVDEGQLMSELYLFVFELNCYGTLIMEIDLYPHFLCLTVAMS